MKNFAEIDDYVKRYGDHGVDFGLLDECLKDASRKIAALLENHGIDWKKANADYKERMMQVCRDMAHRAMVIDESDDPFMPGVTQGSVSANGFSTQYLFGNNSYGELYITKSEKQLLGLSRMRIATMECYYGKLEQDKQHGRR